MSPRTALGSLVHCSASGVHHGGCTYPHMASTLKGPASPETGGAASSGPWSRCGLSAGGARRLCLSTPCSKPGRWQPVLSWGEQSRAGVPELQGSLVCVASGQVASSGIWAQDFTHTALCPAGRLGLTCRWRRDVDTEGQKVKRSGQMLWGTEQRPLGQGATAGGCV